MTKGQAEAIAEALGGTRASTGSDLALAACLQAADELNVISQAINNGATEVVTCSALSGLESRLRAAVELAGYVELALDGAEEGAEVQP